jgi:hypothetical protein
MARYRVTYNLFGSYGNTRLDSKAKLTIEVEVPRGEKVNDVAYGEASNLLHRASIVIGGDEAMGPPVSVEKLQSKKRIRYCQCGAAMPEED